MKIWTVDAFTDTMFTGNPAAVCIVQDFPPQDLMQSIAYEMNISETAFVKPLSPTQYHIRWFTPHSEAPLCGHATLAATQILMQEGYQNDSDTITFQSLGGELVVNKTGDWINLNFPYFPVVEIPLTDELLDIVKIQPIFTGFSENCLFMEFETPEQIRKLTPDLKLLSTINCRALIITSFDHQFDFISRYFAPRVGIDEDPVCASAHCRLVPYWTEKLQKTEFTAYQASKRGGIIKCKNLENRVLISGKAVTVFQGTLNTSNIREIKDVA